MLIRTTRRDALKILGAAGATALGCGSSASEAEAPAGGAGAGGATGGASGGETAAAGTVGRDAGVGGNAGSGNAGTGGQTAGAGGNGGLAGNAGSGNAGGGGVGGAPSTPCIVRPVQTEGPYFLDEMLNRSDIRVDPSDGTVSEGVPLRVVLRVYRIDGGACVPVTGAMVDLWQCDALGIYSGVVDAGGAFDTTGKQFLRGYQLTDDTGTVEFLSIYPGWYTGRTVHLHFKVRTDPASATGLEFTSQLYFDDAITDTVMTEAPYDQKTSTRIRNAQDGIFLAGGSELMLALREDGPGYEGTFDLGLEID